MSRVAEWAQAFALGIGGPGLFVIAFLDSSFLSLPQINDLLVILMVIQHKERMVYYAIMATLGSVAGCLVLYSIARKGGEMVIRRRFGGPSVDRAERVFQKYGVLAIVVPAILPPPAPFKLFVLMAGVARLPAWQFAAAIAASRGFRYFAWSFLAVLYGDEAMVFIAEHGNVLSVIVATTVLAAGMLYFLVLRRRRAAAAGIRAGEVPGRSR